MNVIVGIVLVLGCVAGGFVLSHGKLAACGSPMNCWSSAVPRWAHS